jgi:hypothetical protein
MGDSFGELILDKFLKSDKVYFFFFIGLKMIIDRVDSFDSISSLEIETFETGLLDTIINDL